MWQGVKFGGAPFGMAALLAVDALSMGDGRSGRASSVARSWGLILGAFALVQAAWAALAFALLPPVIAGETLWPSYMIRGYDDVTQRYPGWSGLRFFVGQQLLLLDCGLIGFSMLALRLVRTISGRGPASAGTGADHCLAIGAVFLLVSAPFYLKHVWHFYQFGWLLIFPAAWGISRMGAPWRIAAALALAPSFLLMARITLVNRPADGLVHYHLPGGEVLLVRPDTAREIDMLASLSPSDGSTGGDLVIVMFGWGGGGYYYYFNYEYPIRSYMIGTVAFRPYDADQLTTYLPRVVAFVISTEGMGRDRIEAKIRATFPPPLASRIIEGYEIDLGRSVGRYVVLAQDGPHRFARGRATGGPRVVFRRSTDR